MSKNRVITAGLCNSTSTLWQTANHGTDELQLSLLKHSVYLVDSDVDEGVSNPSAVLYPHFCGKVIRLDILRVGPVYPTNKILYL